MNVVGVAETPRGNRTVKREKRSRRKGAGGAENDEQGPPNDSALLPGLRKQLLELLYSTCEASSLLGSLAPPVLQS